MHLTRRLLLCAHEQAGTAREAGAGVTLILQWSMCILGGLTGDIRDSLALC